MSEHMSMRTGKKKEKEKHESFRQISLGNKPFRKQQLCQPSECLGSFVRSINFDLKVFNIYLSQAHLISSHLEDSDVP